MLIINTRPDAVLRGAVKVDRKTWAFAAHRRVERTLAVKRFREGLVLKAHILLCHSSLGLSVRKKKKKKKRPRGGAQCRGGGVRRVCACV